MHRTPSTGAPIIFKPVGGTERTTGLENEADPIAPGIREGVVGTGAIADEPDLALVVGEAGVFDIDEATRTREAGVCFMAIL
jgi:hypothetical protein